MLIETSWDSAADGTRQEIVQRLLAPLRQYFFHGKSSESTGDHEHNGNARLKESNGEEEIIEGDENWYLLALEEAMLTQDSGSMILSPPSSSLSSSNSSFDGNSKFHVTSISKHRISFWDNLLRPNNIQGLQWHKISVHWIWQGVEQDIDDNEGSNSNSNGWDEINLGSKQSNPSSSIASSVASSVASSSTLTCCMNVLSPKVISFFHEETKSTSESISTPHPTIQMENVQWTLEAAANDNNTTSSEGNNRSTLRSFWKVDSCILLGFMHCQNISLLGDMESFEVPTMPPVTDGRAQNYFSLRPNATLTIKTIQLASTPSSLPMTLPRTSMEHIQVANLVRSLDQVLVPDLHWQSPPKVIVGHANNGSDHTFQTLGRIFRYAYNYLEDKEEQEAKQKAQEGDTNKSSSTGLPRIDWKQSLEDSLAITAGCVATGASFITPVGAAVAVAAVGVKDGVVAAAQKGRSVRTMNDNENDGGNGGYSNRSFDTQSNLGGSKGEWQGQSSSSSSREGASSTKNDARYYFGDVTRGVMATIQERRQQRQQQQNRTFDDGNNDGEGSSSHFFGERNRARYAGVVGSSVGAALGLAVVGGPVGVVAGSVVAGAAAQTAVQRQSSANGNNVDATVSDSQGGRKYGQPHSEEFNPDDEIVRQLERRNMEHSPTKTSNPSGSAVSSQDNINSNNDSGTGTGTDTKQAYRFGDITRGIVERGKQAMGRDTDSPYRFGDISRGLFSSSKK